MTQREIINAATGERIVIRSSAIDSDGRLLAFDLFLPPGGHVPARHAHPVQEERFTIVEGCLDFRLRWQTVRAQAGDVLVIPPNTPHWFGNRGPDAAHAVVEVRPALRMEELLSLSEHLSRQPTRARLRGLARLLLEFQRELAVPYIPRWFLRVLLAPFARA